MRNTFIYPVLNEKHRKYGGSFLNAPVINPEGDWRKSLPPHEEQRRFNVEPSSCFVEAQQHAIATIEERQLKELDNNYSARFNALLAGGTEFGGDPIAAADSIRTDGLVKEESMPHTDSLESWADFHSWKGVDETKVRSEGREYLKKKSNTFGVVVERDMPLQTKLDVIREALKRSPLPMSVYGVTDPSGDYIPKPEGVWDTHMVEATYIDSEDKIHILDTYPPFEKVLPPRYNTDFAMGWTVSRRELSTSSWWKRLLEWLIMLFKK